MFSVSGETLKVKEIGWLRKGKILEIHYWCNLIVNAFIMGFWLTFRNQSKCVGPWTTVGQDHMQWFWDSWTGNRTVILSSKTGIGTGIILQGYMVPELEL